MSWHEKTTANWTMTPTKNTKGARRRRTKLSCLVGMEVKNAQLAAASRCALLQVRVAHPVRLLVRACRESTLSNVQRQTSSERVSRNRGGWGRVCAHVKSHWSRRHRG